MITLVFSARKKDTTCSDSWWDTLARQAREAWWPGVKQNYEDRLKYQGTIPEPTARKLKSRKHKDRDAISGEVVDDAVEP